MTRRLPSLVSRTPSSGEDGGASPRSALGGLFSRFRPNARGRGDTSESLMEASLPVRDPALAALATAASVAAPRPSRPPHIAPSGLHVRRDTSKMTLCPMPLLWPALAPKPHSSHAPSLQTG